MGKGRGTVASVPMSADPDSTSPMILGQMRVPHFKLNFGGSSLSHGPRADTSRQLGARRRTVSVNARAAEECRGSGDGYAGAGRGAEWLGGSPGGSDGCVSAGSSSWT